MKYLKKLNYQLIVVPVIFTIILLRQFPKGLTGFLDFLQFFLSFVLSIIFQTPNKQLYWNAIASLDSSLLFIFFGFTFYWVLYRLTLFILAQFVLPVEKWADRYKAYQYLVLFTRGKHGPAISVRDGERISRRGELDSAKPGVALVDLSSAVALVQHNDVKSLALDDDVETAPKREPYMSSLSLKKKKKGVPLRIAKGPGVVFTEAGQKIDDTVDLRRQSRAKDNLTVYTRDGIKVESKVTVNFSLSDDPEILLVGYIGGDSAEHFKVFQAEQSRNQLTVKKVFDVEVDVEDAQEAIQAPLLQGEFPVGVNAIPAGYYFDRQRVEHAVFHQARDKDGKPIRWHQVPLEIATDVFRELLSKVPYDRFFSNSLLTPPPSERNQKPESQIFISNLKDIFSIKVRMRGLISLQFIQPVGGGWFSVDVSAPAQKHVPVILNGEKFNHFRHMGIVIKNASFGDVRALNSEIQAGMMNNWKARVDSEVAISNAESELEAIRVRNRNRALMQEEMTHLLSGMFQSVPHFDEALALRVLQALETSVTDSSNKEMPSADLHEILKHIYEWVLLETPSSASDKNGTDNNSHVE